MICGVKYITLLYILCRIILVGTVDLQVIALSKQEDNTDNNDRVVSTFLQNMLRINNEKNGIFQSFVRNLLQMLTTEYKSKRLRSYCRTLIYYLEQMEYRMTKKLAKHLKELAKMDGSEIKNDLEIYKKELEADLPHRRKFITAMNEVFTYQQAVFFDNYILDLRDYGIGDKLDIDDETRILLNDIIIGSIKKISVIDQEELSKKLRKAVKEYVEKDFDELWDMILPRKVTVTNPDPFMLKMKGEIDVQA